MICPKFFRLATMCNYSNIAIKAVSSPVRLIPLLLQFWCVSSKCFTPYSNVFLQSALLHTPYFFFWKIILCSVISFSHSFYYICLCSTEFCAVHMNRMWFITHIAVPVVGDLAYSCWREIRSLFLQRQQIRILGQNLVLKRW